jgi:putative oxidoreductase
MKAVFVAGRVVFGAFFLHSGINHFWERDKMAEYAASKGVPAPDAAVAASGVLLTLGGVSLIAGKKTRLGGAAAVLFLSAVSPVMHNFWAASARDKQNELIHFSKNMALLGAALCLATAREPRR